MKARAILLVEDNPDDEMLTLRALKKNNIVNEITVAHDGAEALDLIFSKASSGEPLPGLVLLDLKLPKVEGLEVMRRIRADERTSIIPVVDPDRLQAGRRYPGRLPGRRQCLCAQTG